EPGAARPPVGTWSRAPRRSWRAPCGRRSPRSVRWPEGRPAARSRCHQGTAARVRSPWDAILLRTMAGATPAELIELRVLDGPNVYFTRPAMKLTLEAERWLRAPEDRVARVLEASDLIGSAGGSGRPAAANPGVPGTQQRWRYVARLAAQ